MKHMLPYNRVPLVRMKPQIMKNYKLQAREIICKAKQEMEKICEDRLKENGSKIENEDLIVSLKANSGLSMKRSLQRFLLQRRSIKRRALLDDSSSNS